MALLTDLEKAVDGHTVPLGDVLKALPYNADGLIAAIAQDADSLAVLMLAWMDRRAIEMTLASGFATYYSRSRRAYWRKGESSGHLQTLVTMQFDCDGDAVLLTVRQTGAACHTNRPTCFYLAVDGQNVRVLGDQP